MGIDFVCHPANINEDISSVHPPLLPLVLAQEKAFAVSRLYPKDLVIGVDTIVSIDNEVIGKPKDMDGAKQILLKLSGRKHKVISGVCLAGKTDHIMYSFTETSLVKFKKINIGIIREYFSYVNPMDKAGAYAIQEHGNMIIEGFKGSRNNIIGLPTKKLADMLKFISTCKKGCKKSNSKTQK